LARDGKSFLQISVFDNGPGISPADKSKLFKPFSKLAAHSHLNPNGSGLGLSICKLICQSLGGDI
jgi:signal transduction histidine kinase